MHLTPALLWWILAAAAIWLVRRPRGVWPPVLLGLCSTAVILETALGFPADRNYSAPFLPVVILLAAAMLAAPRRGAAAAAPYPPPA
jgi:hypothetical protein